MIVGVAVIEIHVEDSQSLKAKRGVVRSIAARLRNKFNVSVGEVGGQGTWQRATIGLSMTGSDEVAIRRALTKAIKFAEDTHLAQVLDSDLEIIRMPLADEAPMSPGENHNNNNNNNDDEEEDWPWEPGEGRDDASLNEE
jgi:hypothetical protein